MFNSHWAGCRVFIICSVVCAEREAVGVWSSEEIEIAVAGESLAIVCTLYCVLAAIATVSFGFTMVFMIDDCV